MSEPKVLRAPADFDIYNAPTFRDQLVQAIYAGWFRIVVDMSDVEFIDSTGLGILIGNQRRTRGFEGWLKLAAPTDKVRRAFRMSGLNKVFDVFDTVEAALASETEGVTTS